MRKLIVHMLTGYCGSDVYEAVGFADDISDKEIGEDLWNMTVQHAESYGFVYDEDDCGDDEDTDYADPDYSYEDYDPAKHDMHRQGGGSFKDDF